MKLLGEKIFARDAEGKLVSRIGTIFFRTPGLVTQRGVHAMQRIAWIEEIQRELGRELSPEEAEAEISESVDLVFTEEHVLIRPNPERMDLAFRADEELQRLVPKLNIRFLNTSSELVRRALRERGENWRMARAPISQEDMAELIANSKVPVGERPIYYYNRTTGTRFLTAETLARLESLAPDDFRRQMAEIVRCLGKRNRQGYPEVDVFPPTMPIEIKRALQALKPEEAPVEELRTEIAAIIRRWRMALPSELRDESPDNFEWRNAMCQTLTRGPNETAAVEQELVAGISPEFYRQIEWLPGVRIVDGEVVFDSVYAEAARTQAPQLLAKCDNRVKSFLFNTTRLLGRVKYINVGRIARSLSRPGKPPRRRGHLYIMQYGNEGEDEPKVMMIRLQKWGVAEHLDEGKGLLQAILEADEYSDYVLDRRLMCRQLGMNLPHQLAFGNFTEKYRGNNQYNGVAVRTGYFVRDYERGTASDKVPRAKYRNPAWAQKFAFLMGGAAAVDLIVGRRDSETGKLIFDCNFEVVVSGDDGLPAEVKVTDHAGSFVDYTHPLEESVPLYAQFVRDREKLVDDLSLFAKAYVDGFHRTLAETQAAYRARRTAFDCLFIDRPYDTNGSGAYRWACALRRLDACDPDRLAARLSECIGC